MSTELSWTQPWQPQLNWKSPAGQLLERMVEALPLDNKWHIAVFGSAPLQLAFDPAFLSADVDLFSFDKDIEPYCEQAKLTEGAKEFYIDPCSISAFNAPPGWEHRSYKADKGHVIFTLPHPIDILTSKVMRMERKDFRAFELVRRVTNHPTEEEMLWALRLVFDIFRPSFDEEQASNVHGNVKQLWREFFGRDIDIPAQIIRPGVKQREESYRQSGKGTKNLLGEL
jgi:hypothetical protein